MGTNYYVIKNKPSISNPIHIGKCSYGQLFLFHEHNNTFNDPPVIWNTYEQIKEWLHKYTVETDEYVIITEYDEIVSFDDFFKMVDEKQNSEFDKSNLGNFKHCRNVNGYRFSDEYFS